MMRNDALFAAVNANPAPVVEQAIARLITLEGRPVKATATEVRFRHSGSLWIDPRTGNWRDWAAGAGGGSWLLATELAGLGETDIADLYRIDPGVKLSSRDRGRLETAAKERLRAAALADAGRRAARRRESERLLSEATPSAPGDPASRYLLGRGLTDLADLWFHPGPVIKTAEGVERQLAPSLLYPVTNGDGDLCAVHAVQLDPSRDRQLTGRRTKISIGSLMEGYVRFGPSSPVVCLGEGAETVASVAGTVPHWRCLASCSGIRFVDHDPDLAAARQILLLAERGVENQVRDKGHALLSEGVEAAIYLVHVPESVTGDTADLNDALQLSSDLVRHALSANQLERLHAVT